MYRLPFAATPWTLARAAADQAGVAELPGSVAVHVMQERMGLAGEHLPLLFMVP